MRPIDADELKTHKFLSPQVRILGGRRNGKAIVAAYQQGWNDAIDAIVDNALTVEPFEPDYVGAERLKARQRGYEEGYHRGMKIGKTLNPKTKKGEWIFGSTLGHGWMKCSNCCVSQSGQTSCWSYCPNCGADMRKGGAE